MQTPTLRDVADAAGVHPATASRALNPATRGLVNAETARRVIKVAERLGYRPNPIARSLKTAKSGTVGLVIPDLTNPLFPPIVRGIEDVLEPAGYSGLIVNTDNDPEPRAGADRVAALPPGRGAHRRHRAARAPAAGRSSRREGVPMVLVNRRPDGLDVPSMTADDAAGIELAVDHLAGLGHTPDRAPRRPADHLDRRGPAPRLPRRGPRPRPRRRPGAGRRPATPGREADGADALRALLDAGAEFTAVVAGNDLLALGCYDVFAERGLSCPATMSVVGFNDMPFLDKLRPPLTTCASRTTQIGAEAARMLLDAISEPDRLAALGAAAAVARRTRVDGAGAGLIPRRRTAGLAPPASAGRRQIADRRLAQSRGYIARPSRRVAASLRISVGSGRDLPPPSTRPPQTTADPDSEAAMRSCAGSCGEEGQRERGPKTG